jgi:hypothetical protein
MKPLLRCLLLALVVPCHAFDLSPYPRSREIVLGTVHAEVRPAHSQKIKATQSGLLQLHLPASGATLSQGTLWAEFDPARLALEREALALARQLITEKEVPGLRLEQSRTRAELSDKLDELDRQAAMLGKILHDPALAELYLTEETRAQDIDKVRYLVTQIDQQRRLTRAVLAYAGTPRQEELEVRVLELKLRQQELELARREQESRLVMPFDGEITFIPPAPTSDRPLRVEAGMDLAWLQDFSRLHVRLVLRQTDWRLVDPARLTLRLGTGTLGRPLSAGFVRRLTEEVFGREELAYYFVVDPERTTEARPLVGGQVGAQVIAALPETAHLVPKLDLVLAEPATFRLEGWTGGLAKLLPGARVLLVGETHLAIAVP